MKPIPFNKPYIPLASLKNLAIAAMSGTIAGNGRYTKLCHGVFEKRFGFKKVLLTTSCSDALEMAAILCGIEPGDEVIMPSFTFMSTANAFLLRGAKIVFADTLPDVPNIDPAGIEKLVTSKTKAIVVVHYSGIACDMDAVMAIADKYRIKVVEDAAHAFDSYYNGRPLGSIGHFGTFSFHETKNIISGEGGLLAINRQEYETRSEIIWEKGTNRAAFYRGETDKYGWVDIGSSFLPPDTTAAILYTQLCRLDRIQDRRRKIWRNYFEQLKPLEDKGLLKRPFVPGYGSVNGNMFYLLANSSEEQVSMLNHLKKHGIHAVFHYFPLHSSNYFREKHDGRQLPNTDRFSSCIVRLPLFYHLKEKQVGHIVKTIEQFFQKQ
jgi:dTDP-4-amino-4,6-dideoxygalactose transaminase